jgi:hypothetical protein
MQYSFGIPGPAIWLTHIIIGLILVYIGYNLLNNKEIGQPLIIGLIVVGTLVILYHAHLFYYYTYSQSK